jgi:hypothetical protein
MYQQRQPAKSVGTSTNAQSKPSAQQQQQQMMNPYAAAAYGQPMAYPAATVPLMQSYYPMPPPSPSSPLMSPAYNYQAAQQQQQMMMMVAAVQQQQQQQQQQLLQQQQHHSLNQLNSDGFAGNNQSHTVRITRYSDTLTRSSGKKTKLSSNNGGNQQQPHQTSYMPSYYAGPGLMSPTGGAYVSLPPLNTNGVMTTATIPGSPVPPMSPIIGSATGYAYPSMLSQDGWQSPVLGSYMQQSGNYAYQQQQQQQQQGTETDEDGVEMAAASGYRTRERRNSATQTKSNSLINSRNGEHTTQQRYYSDENSYGPDRGYKPYTIREFRDLKKKDNQVRYGRLGPDHASNTWRQAVSCCNIY